MKSLERVVLTVKYFELKTEGENILTIDIVLGDAECSAKGKSSWYFKRLFRKISVKLKC